MLIAISTCISYRCNTSIAAGDVTDSTQSAGDVMTSLSLWHYTQTDRNDGQNPSENKISTSSLGRDKYTVVTKLSKRLKTNSSVVRKLKQIYDKKVECWFQQSYQFFTWSSQW